ncbi:Deleted in malignant brain tumors 1 protein [Geodia barretti]|uniref:Deleted in malignant brain tumors 1 protein n=1 Tax=Geodia barretti TaxID=519541 RepID=A0AA35RZZ3_GEOBA|nr:Deleted in malignant brain tumors 1 protein [Geodia barretti]
MHAEFGPGSGLIFLDNVNCNGTESNLLQCRGNEPGNHDCGHSEDAGVYCPDPTANCTNGDVRLVGGTTEYEGRVELCVGGSWGTVCADFFWDGREASVVCRQLGLLHQNAIAVGSAAYGPGEGRILFQTVQCSGSESALLDCVFSSPSNSSDLCSSHLQDASVVCRTIPTQPPTLPSRFIVECSVGLFTATLVSADCSPLAGSQDISRIESYQIGGVDQSPASFPLLIPLASLAPGGDDVDLRLVSEGGLSVSVRFRLIGFLASTDRACLVHVVRTELRVIRVLIIYCIGYTDYTLSYNNATFLSGTEFPVLVPGTTLTDGLNSFVFRATGVG